MTAVNTQRDKMKVGLYIHIPFCIKKCHYCDFNSYLWKADLAVDYLDALEKEIDLWAEQNDGSDIKTIYIGGGTPTCLSGEQIRDLMNYCQKRFAIVKGAEVTIEANPGTLDYDKLQILKESGINRLSLGVQSFNDNLLKTLGRIHSSKEAKESFYLAREVGFNNINLDLIFALPDQNINQWKETLQHALSLNPEHISLYNLTIEPGTKFYQDKEAGQLNLPDEETELRMYQIAIETLKESGYEHYEISNFAKPGKKCAHNQIYWLNEDYLGLGAGAHSHIGRRRFWNVRRPEEYIDKLNKNESPVNGFEDLSEAQQRGETMMLGLRLLEGIEFERFRQRFNCDLREVYRDAVRKLKRLDLVECDSKRIRLSHQGLFVANLVFSEFVG